MAAGAARRLVAPTLTTVAMLVVLVGLGVWQLERLQWKEHLLHAIDAAEAAPPVTLAGDPPQFTKVVATGVLRAGDFAFYGLDMRGVTPGRFLLGVLDRAEASPLVVDLGWVPETGGDQYPHGPMTVTGYVREPAKPGLFTPADDTAHRAFYTLDPQKVGAVLGAPDVAPFTLVAVGQSDAIPSPASALPRPPNDHFGYALTWFGLGGTLLVTYALYVRKVLRP